MQQLQANRLFSVDALENAYAAAQEYKGKLNAICMLFVGYFCNLSITYWYDEQHSAFRRRKEAAPTIYLHVKVHASMRAYIYL